MVETQSERVLFLAPTRRDAQITTDLLSRSGLAPFHCETMLALAREIPLGVGAILLTEDAIFDPRIRVLADCLAQQPQWSDVPVVLLAKSYSLDEVQSVVASITNITFVERPAAVPSLISAVRTAVRSRSRQYQIRDKVQEIAQAAEQFELMANSIPQLAWMANPDGSVFWVNQQWLEYTGSTHEEVMGWGWTDTLDASEVANVSALWQDSLEHGTPFERECSLRGADGSMRAFFGVGAAIRGEGGRIVRWLGTFTDVEEHVRIEAARESLLESERQARAEAERAARVKDEFLATLSHELRTPLSSILGWAYLLKKSGSDPDIVSDAGEVISRSGEVLKALVDDLLDLSRIASGKLRLEFDDVNLSDLANASVEAARPAADAKSIEILTRFPLGKQEVRGDPARLQQIVTNLLSNAIRFTPNGGEITVSIEFKPSTVALQVSDNGQGIDAEFLPHLFDRFRQADSSSARKHGGMGIGLSLVKQFTELHGGHVSVASDGPGHGSTFTVEIPTASVAEVAVLGPGVGHDADLTGFSVLVVDDDKGIRELVGRILTEAGAETRVVASAIEAVSEVEYQQPDVLISDIGMPGRDGYQLIEELRESGHQMPAIAMTAFVQEQDHDRALQAGFQQHLPKPVQPGKLIEAVRFLASRSQVNPQL